MIIKIEEPIYQTSLKIIIGELSIFAKLFPHIELNATAEGYCYVDNGDGTIWMKEFSYETLDHELTHFIAGVGEYLGLDYNYTDELLPYLRGYYVSSFCKITKYKFPALDIKKKY